LDYQVSVQVMTTDTCLKWFSLIDHYTKHRRRKADPRGSQRCEWSVSNFTLSLP